MEKTKMLHEVIDEPSMGMVIDRRQEDSPKT